MSRQARENPHVNDEGSPGALVLVFTRPNSSRFLISASRCPNSPARVVLRPKLEAMNLFGRNLLVPPIKQAGPIGRAREKPRERGKLVFEKATYLQKNSSMWPISTQVPLFRQ